MKLKVKGILRTPPPPPPPHGAYQYIYNFHVECVQVLELIENPFSLILKILIRGDGVLLVG